MTPEAARDGRRLQPRLGGHAYVPASGRELTVSGGSFLMYEENKSIVRECTSSCASTMKLSSRVPAGQLASWLLWMPARRLTTRSHRLESRNLHLGLPLAYSARRVPSAPPANSANRPADPEDAPSREGDAGQRKARNVHHRFEPDLIVGDANVAFGRGPAARATATTAAFLRPGVAFRLLATPPPRTVPIAEGESHLRHWDDGHAALLDRLAEHSSHS